MLPRPRMPLDDRVVAVDVNPAARTEGLAPVGSRHPRPPLPPVAEVDRSGCRAEHERPGGEVRGCDALVQLRVKRTLGDADMAGLGDEPRELRAGHGVPLDGERANGLLMDRPLVGVEPVGSHREPAARHVDQLGERGLLDHGPHATPAPACQTRLRRVIPSEGGGSIWVGPCARDEPHLVRDPTVPLPAKTPGEGYHVTGDLADDAIHWLHRHKALQPDGPFFMHRVSGCMHGPCLRRLNRPACAKDGGSPPLAHPGHYCTGRTGRVNRITTLTNRTQAGKTSWVHSRVPAASSRINALR